MDSDLDIMDVEDLKLEVIKLRQAIRQHRDSSDHDLCWFHPELWSLLPEQESKLPIIPDACEFIERCAQYRRSLGK